MKYFILPFFCLLVVTTSCTPSFQQPTVLVEQTVLVTTTPWIITATPIPTNNLADTLELIQPVSTTPAPLTTIRVMSYNILTGGDIDPALVSQQGFQDTRLAKVLTIIKAVNPDILGIQEANQWEVGTPSVAQLVAKELGMNYFLAESEDGYHVALFTKFDIVSTENLSDEIGNSHALRATLSTSTGQLINIFVIHLVPFLWNTATRVPQVESLTEEISPYTSSFAILMGDMNFRAGDTQVGEITVSAEEYPILQRTGWFHVTGLVDQIWVSPTLKKSVKELVLPKGLSVLYTEASDHFPVGIEINIYPLEHKPKQE